MQLQNFSPDKGQEQILKKIESRETSPAQLAREMLQQGDARVTELKSQIDDLIGELGWEPGQEQAILQLRMVLAELDRAHSELRQDLKAADTSEVDEGWSETTAQEPQEETLDAWAVALEESDKAFAEGACSPRLIELLATPDGERAFRQNLNDAAMKLHGETTDFKALDMLRSFAKQDERVGNIVASEIAHSIGEKAWRRLLDDEGYRADLEAIQNDLSKKVGKKERALCRELGLAQLVLLHEMFGRETAQLVANVDLATYCSELELSDGEIVLAPSLDPESGLMGGNISVFYEYGDQPGDARMHRHFSSKPIKGDGGYALEKSTTLELITLPDRVKNNNTARQEMATTNRFLKDRGFGQEKLHANIDIGGYCWAAMGFGWDIDKMRRADQQGKTAAEIVSGFINEQLRTLMKNLSDSGLDPNADDIRTILDPIRQRLEDSASGALITPQELAGLGKGGPTFVKAKSGKYYRSENYPDHESKDPPLESIKGPQHLGKMLLIGSDWYGQKPL